MCTQLTVVWTGTLQFCMYFCIHSGLWFGAVGCGLVQWTVVWYSGLWFGTVDCGLVQWTVVWYSGLWFGTVGCGLVQWTVVWYSEMWLLSMYIDCGTRHHSVWT